MGDGACRWEGPVHGGGACRWEGPVHKGGACRWERQPTEKVVALVGVDPHLHFTIFDFCTLKSHYLIMAVGDWSSPHTHTHSCSSSLCSSYMNPTPHTHSIYL